MQITFSRKPKCTFENGVGWWWYQGIITLLTINEFNWNVGIKEKNLLMNVVTLLNKRWPWEGGWQIKIFETLSNDDPTILWLENLSKSSKFLKEPIRGSNFMYFFGDCLPKKCYTQGEWYIFPHEMGNLWDSKGRHLQDIWHEFS